MRILPLGERALLIEVGEGLDPAVNATARALARRLAQVPGVEEAVPALRSVTVVFDPLRADPAPIVEAAERIVPALARAAPAAESGRTLEVPTVYGGEAGPDLEEVAALCRLSVEQAVRLHSGVEYTVYMLGFRPGYPYLGILPEELRVPRLGSPRLQVAEGAVGVAETLTGIYPLPSPGGWRIIGRTPLPIYEPLGADPILFRPGDRVRFTPVRGAAFAERRRAAPLPAPAHPVLQVLAPGLYTTIQDEGRRGHRALGVPPSGAMDLPAMWAANAAVGNPPHAPVLELTAPGPELRVLDRATIAVAGADLSAALDGVPLEPAAPVRVRAGQVLRFGAPRRGMWAYLAVDGGFEARAALGSVSTFVPGMLGGSGGRRLREGDVLGRAGPVRAEAPPRPPLAPEALALPDQRITVRVIPGPQDEWLTEEARAALLNQGYRTSVHSDRAGVRLDGPPLAHRALPAFLSDGIVPGAVQVPAGGRPIVIMPDGPTTGGYPKAAVVIAADLRLVAQARPGTAVRFRPAAMEEALDALRRMMRMRGTG